jgi:hypothetical protein
MVERLQELGSELARTTDPVWSSLDAVGWVHWKILRKWVRWFVRLPEAPERPDTKERDSPDLSRDREATRIGNPHLLETEYSIGKKQAQDIRAQCASGEGGNRYGVHSIQSDAHDDGQKSSRDHGDEKEGADNAQVAVAIEPKM